MSSLLKNEEKCNEDEKIFDWFGGLYYGIGMLMLPLSASAAEQKEKVILDTDMVEMFDDGVALRMLAKSPRVDLLGVTCVTATAGCRKVLHIHSPNGTCRHSKCTCV